MSNLDIETFLSLLEPYINIENLTKEEKEELYYPIDLRITQQKSIDEYNQVEGLYSFTNFKCTLLTLTDYQFSEFYLLKMWKLFDLYIRSNCISCRIYPSEKCTCSGITSSTHIHWNNIFDNSTKEIFPYISTINYIMSSYFN